MTALGVVGEREELDCFSLSVGLCTEAESKPWGAEIT